MNLTFQALRNVGSNWFVAILTILVGIFLSPFILHRLGDEIFGLWILIFSLTGYFGIFDFGVRGSIVKYVAEFEATGDRDRLNRIINVSMGIYTCVALGTLVVVSISSLYVQVLFHISPGYLHTVRLLVLMVGVTIAIGFPLSVFAGILEGLQMFYFINLMQAIATLVRALLIVIALSYGEGLLLIVFITVVIPLFSYAIYAWKVVKTIPLQFGARFVDRATIRQVLNYSVFSFVSMLAWRLRFQTDAVIIGAMLSSSAITYFSIGSKLVTYPSLLIVGLSQIFTPMSSQFDATGDRQRLQKLLLLGNRACALTMMPISTVLLILGKSVIDVWVGPQYEASYVIIVILLIPSLLYDIQTSSRQILYGMGRHKALAYINIGEAVVNVIASIVLIHFWGIVGDALGTAIPLAITSTFFLPPYLCRLLKIPLWEFLRQAYLLPLALCAPMAATLWFMHHLFRAHTYLQLAVQVAAGCLIYGIGLIWLFLTKEPMGQEMQTKCRQYILQAVGR